MKIALGPCGPRTPGGFSIVLWWAITIGSPVHMGRGHVFLENSNKSTRVVLEKGVPHLYLGEGTFGELVEGDQSCRRQFFQ